MLGRAIWFVTVLGLLLAGCAKKHAVKPAEEPVAAVPMEDEDVSPDEPSIRYEDWQPLPQLRTAYFEYDRAELTPAARDILAANAEELKKLEGIQVLVEGHCDERGTVAYNLGLGQRRAAAVREFYGHLGLSLARIGTISFGGEKPVDPARTEAAWAKNRRAETMVRFKKNRAPAPAPAPEAAPEPPQAPR